MEEKYFSRKINEGAVKRTHVCSFDPEITLTMVVTGSKKVIDYLLKAQANQMAGEKDIILKSEQQAKENFIRALSGLRINGLSIVYEDLDKCFDSEEIMEVMAFVNDGDMAQFGGESSGSKND
jgi:hypothetical protein